MHNIIDRFVMKENLNNDSTKKKNQHMANLPDQLLEDFLDTSLRAP